MSGPRKGAFLFVILGYMSFETKDSGRRAEFPSGMVRDVNDEKPRFSLIMPKDMPYGEQLLTRWAALMTRGRDKYGERNWEKAVSEKEMERFRDSGLRHMMQWMGDETDEDHAAAVCFNLQGAEYVKWKLKHSVSMAPGEGLEPSSSNYPDAA